PPAYYYRPGYGLGTNKWLIYLMGGRWCLSPSQCRLRADTDLGSTNGWPRPGDPGFESNLDSMGAGFQGMLSGDSSENPYFYSWNMVVVLYCDGGVFAGVKGKMLYDHSQPYYLSGRPILNSILGDLNNKGMKEADSVLLTGCSAGAIAVSMACDAMAQFHFPRTAKVKCLMDAGFFMDTPDITGQYSFRGIVQRMFRFHSMTAAADDDCRTAFWRSKELWRCFFPQYNLQYVSTPMFIVQSTYDKVGAGISFSPPRLPDNNTLDRCMTPGLNRVCSAPVLRSLDQYRLRLRTAINDVVARASATRRSKSAFIVTDDAHCMAAYPDWNKRVGRSGLTLAMAITHWWRTS
ncbi:unnamed protein product, partial [Closterium sp. NIES-54]